MCRKNVPRWGINIHEGLKTKRTEDHERHKKNYRVSRVLKFKEMDCTGSGRQTPELERSVRQLKRLHGMLMVKGKLWQALRYRMKLTNLCPQRIILGARWRISCRGERLKWRDELRVHWNNHVLDEVVGVGGGCWCYFSKPKNMVLGDIQNTERRASVR